MLNDSLTPRASLAPSTASHAVAGWKRVSILAAAALLHTSLAWSQGLPSASPESVGMSTQRLEKITSNFQADIDARKLPGAVVMVARKGKLVYSKAFGSLNNAANAPMQND